MKVHSLKVWPKYFDAIKEGLKKFDVRLDDRSFRKGDALFLEEYLPKEGFFTGRALLRKVTYVLRGGKFGIEEGYVVLGIEEVKR